MFLFLKDETIKDLKSIYPFRPAIVPVKTFQAR